MEKTLTLDDYMRMPYQTTIEADECGGKLCFMAYHSELSGCMAQGETPQEAVQNLKSARRDYIAALLKRNLSVPIPEIWDKLPEVMQSLSRSVIEQGSLAEAPAKTPSASLVLSRIA